MSKETELLLRQLAREKNAREQAEKILEEKSLELYLANIELHKFSIDLSDKEAKTRAILEATADGVVVVDKKNIIKMCNPAAGKIFNYDPSELINKNINTIIQNVKGVLSYKKNVLYELNGISKNKVLVPIELIIAEIKSTQQIFVYAMHNISERKQIEKHILAQHAVMRALIETNSLEAATAYLYCVTSASIWIWTLAPLWTS